MEEIKVSSFEEFERMVEKKISKIEKQRKSNPFKVYSNPLFRGQRNSSWKLETTLERHIKSSEYPFLDYFQKMKNVQKDIQIFIEGKKWNLNIPPFGDDKGPEIPNEEIYNFMIYLRHHGFPSPLLDWTSSKEVASFFAFQNTSDEKYVSVYVYFDYIGRGEAYWAGISKIRILGPDIIKPDIRHEKQASWYMLSIKTIEDTEIICNIEDAIKNGMYSDEKLEKYLIPSEERKKVLEKLEKSGIDAYTLFQDEDSLMERLKKREFPLEES